MSLIRAHPVPLSTFVVSLIVALPVGALPRPVGEPIDLRPDDCGVFDPDVALAGGRLLVAWDDPSGVATRGGDDSPVTLDPLRVLSPPPNHSAEPAVVTFPDGTFVVAWRRGGYQEEELVWRAVDVEGTPQGELIVVGAGDDPVAAPLPNGDFVLAWWLERPTATEGVTEVAVELQVWGTDGTPRGAPTVVAAVERTDLHSEAVLFPGLAVDLDGRILVHWQHRSPMPEGSAITENARLHAADGGLLSDAWTVAEAPGWAGTSQAIALGTGRWLFVANCIACDGRMVAQVWDGPEMPGPVHDLGTGLEPTVARVGGGRPVVVWVDWQDESMFSTLMMRSLAADGSPLGPAVPLASETNASRLFYAHPRIRSDGVDRFAIVWQTMFSSPILPDLCDIGVSVHLLELDAALLSDGFESGDVAAWSNVVP